MQKLHIPHLVTTFDVSAVGGNSCLVSLELSEGVSELVDNWETWNEAPWPSVTVLNSLRNIALSPICTVVNTFVLGSYKDLRVVFPELDNDTVTESLQRRFDYLPIHKICYYQSYHDNETTIQHLRREIKELNATGKQRDCLGMTPLHIMACSSKPTIEIYRLLIEKYPETLIMKDKWGDVPLLYAFWCNAPVAVIDLLVGSYKSNHPDYKFDWSGMLRTLVKRNVPLTNIQKFINTQQNSFPGQEYDMQSLVLELAKHDTSQACIDTVQYLLRISITKRLDSLSVRKWCAELDDSISSLSFEEAKNGRNFEEAKNKDRDTKALYNRLATYESIKEGTSLLELALWKTKINIRRNKRTRVGKVSYRDQCRVNCGADIIIRNVLPYLVPKPLPPLRWSKRVIESYV